MYKRLLKDTSLYSISTVLARGFALITVPIYTRILSPADYGVLDLLSYTAAIVVLFMGAALDHAVARFYQEAESELDKKRIASTVLFYNIFIFAVLIPVVKPVAEVLAHGWLDNQVGPETVVLVFIFIWVNAIFYITNNQLKYCFLAKESALCNIGNVIVSIVLGFVFIVYFRWGVFGLFLGQVIGQGLFSLLALYYGRASYALVFHWATLRRMLVYSLPLVPGTLSFYAMQYVDRYVLNDLKGLHEVGLYGIGARLASLVYLLLQGFQGAWHPIVMKSFKDEDAPARFSVVFNYYLIVMLTIMVGLSLFGKEILSLLTTLAFRQGYVVVPLLVFSAIMASIGGFFTYGIQIAQKSHIRLFLNFSALIINVVLAYIFVPWLGIIGAALSTALSFVFLTAVGLMFSQQLYYVPYKWPSIIIAAVFAVAVSNSILFIDFDITIAGITTKAVVVLVVAFVLARLLDIPLNIGKLFRNGYRFRH
jgi:O-antigen/teichoic acid export membrane protein